MQAGSRAMLDHVAGALCLELANTIPNRYSDTSRDWLIEPGVEVWAGSVGLPTITSSSAPPPTDLIVLRETIHGVFSPIAEGESPSIDALDALTALYSQGLLEFGFAATPEGVSRRWPDTETPAVRLARISTSAIDLLTGPRLDRVRECPGCGWLFIDASRNRSRRWCSMETCGNRSKARVHQSRVRAANNSKQ